MRNDWPNGDGKRLLRAELTQRRKALSAAERARESAEICAHILRHDQWQHARTLLAYMPTPDEVDVAPLLAAALERGVTLLLPRMTDGAIVWHRVASLAPELFDTGCFGIHEPRAETPRCVPGEAPAPLIWIVPGVGFDPYGGRLGRGGGHYDRALRAAQAVSGTVGVAFACQMMDEVPMAAHDWRLTSVVSPRGWHAAV